MYTPPVTLSLYEPIYSHIQDETDKYIVQAVRKIGVDVDKDELIKALSYDRQQYDKGYEEGQWDVFETITSVWYGKQCYFPNDDGTVYSRESHQTLPTMEDAINEFVKKVEWDG